MLAVQFQYCCVAVFYIINIQTTKIVRWKTQKNGQLFRSWQVIIQSMAGYFKGCVRLLHFYFCYKRLFSNFIKLYITFLVIRENKTIHLMKIIFFFLADIFFNPILLDPEESTGMYSTHQQHVRSLGLHTTFKQWCASVVLSSTPQNCRVQGSSPH